MCKTEEKTTREWIHKLVDVIEDERDLEAVKWLLQRYAARALNNKYREGNQDEGNA